MLKDQPSNLSVLGLILQHFLEAYIYLTSSLLLHTTFFLNFQKQTTSDTMKVSNLALITFVGAAMGAPVPDVSTQIGKREALPVYLLRPWNLKTCD